MNLLDALENGVEYFSDLFETLIDMVVNAVIALQTFYDMLDEFDTRIVAMVDNCGSSEFDGLPVVKAIATFHYVVGDVVFYLLYMLILFGCLWTIYKLLSAIFDKAKELFSQLSGGFITSGRFSGLLSKLFK